MISVHTKENRAETGSSPEALGYASLVGVAVKRACLKQDEAVRTFTYKQWRVRTHTHIHTIFTHTNTQTQFHITHSTESMSFLPKI